jgi:hypothetical protein
MSAKSVEWLKKSPAFRRRDMIDVEKMHRALDAWPTSFEGFDVYQRLAIDLPMALGTGLFIVRG